MSYWGGLNSNHLLAHLDYNLIKNNPKIIIGYFDMTAITSAVTKKTGLVTFSGPAALSFSKPEPFGYTWDYFESMCINPKEALRISSSTQYADDLFFLREDDDYRIKKNNQGILSFKKGKAEGEIVAGNMQTLLGLCGTEYMPDVSNKILFLIS